MDLKGLTYIVLGVGGVVAFAADINHKEYKDAVGWLEEHLSDTEPVWWKRYCDKIKKDHKICYYVGYVGRMAALMNYVKRN